MLVVGWVEQAEDKLITRHVTGHGICTHCVRVFFLVSSFTFWFLWWHVLVAVHVIFPQLQAMAVSYSNVKCSWSLHSLQLAWSTEHCGRHSTATAMTNAISLMKSICARRSDICQCWQTIIWCHCRCSNPAELVVKHYTSPIFWCTLELSHILPQFFTCY